MLFTIKAFIHDIRHVTGRFSSRAQGSLGEDEGGANHIPLIRILVQIGLTAALLIFSLHYLARGAEDPTLQKTCYTIVGAVVGYWFR
jgi:hypothetical protein